MNTVMPQESLREIFDQAVRQVTKDAAGIQLYQGDLPPDGEVCTLHAVFENGVRSSVSMCADKALFVRLTQRMMRTETVTPQDVEDFAKEYFNALCGRIASVLYRPTKVASRFGIPSFHWGRYQPEGHREHFTLTYFSDQNEGTQLIHHVSCE